MLLQGPFPVGRDALLSHALPSSSGLTHGSLSLLVGISIVVLSLASLLLSLLVVRRYRRGAYSYLWWGSGLFLVFVTVLQEALVYFGTWSQLLIRSYIFLVALLVGLVSVGSVQLVRSRNIRYVYFFYFLIASVVTAYFSFITPVSQDVVVKGIILGPLPTSDILISSLLTGPAATVIAALALYSAVKMKKAGNLFIAAGIIVISIAGTLFDIRTFPVVLYYAEFIGIILLFIGFELYPVFKALAEPHLMKGDAQGAH